MLGVPTKSRDAAKFFYEKPKNGSCITTLNAYKRV